MYLPPLDPSSIPSPASSSLTPNKRMMLQRCERGGFKLRKLNEGNAIQTESNITQENNLVSQPEAGGLVPDTTEPKTEEETQKVSAKEQLYRLCCVRHWKPPVYECSNNEGPPCHRKLFTCKVTTEIKEDSRITVLECFGDPQHKKKIASEQAAKAALWYLKNVGYALQTDNAPGRRG